MKNFVGLIFVITSFFFLSLNAMAEKEVIHKVSKEVSQKLTKKCQAETKGSPSKFTTIERNKICNCYVNSMAGGGYEDEHLRYFLANDHKIQPDPKNFAEAERQQIFEDSSDTMARCLKENLSKDRTK